MKILSILLALAMMSISPLSMMASTKAHEAQMYAGTSVDVWFPTDISVKNSFVEGFVKNNVYDHSGRNIVIRKNAKVRFKSSYIENKSCGRPGQLNITGATVTAVDGSQITLDMYPFTKKGGSRAALVWTVGVLFCPIGLLALFGKGRNPKIKSGTTIPGITVSHNYTIKVEELESSDQYDLNTTPTNNNDNDGFDF